MARFLIRVDCELSKDLLSAFPHLVPELQPVQTTLSGYLDDQAELSGVLNHLNELGVDIVEVVRIPE